jgi:hypothetical protein
MAVRPVCLALLVAVSLSGQAQDRQTFTGVITDGMCPLGTHSDMRMGPTDAECTRACVASHGSPYVLFDGKSAYVLSDQKTPEQYAAQKVRVTGSLDAKTKVLHVESIAPVR